MSHHTHDHSHGGQRALLLALCFTTFFALVELIAGVWANSLALIGDAGHMITDSMALGLGALAAWMSRRPPSRRHSFGLKRAEVLGALLNVLFMIGVIVFIAIEALQRLATPQAVNGPLVMAVAAIGLAVNVGAAWVLHRGEQTLNVRGAMLHVMGDLLGSVAALVAGAVIWRTGWYPIDPLLSVFIGILIMLSSLRLLREVLHVIMEGVPRDIDLPELGRALASTPGVRHVHDLHVWVLDSSSYVAAAHVVIDDLTRWETRRQDLETLLATRFGIHHATLQPETELAEGDACADASCGPVYSSSTRPGAVY